MYLQHSCRRILNCVCFNATNAIPKIHPLQKLEYFQKFGHASTANLTKSALTDLEDPYHDLRLPALPSSPLQVPNRFSSLEANPSAISGSKFQVVEERQRPREGVSKGSAYTVDGGLLHSDCGLNPRQRRGAEGRRGSYYAPLWMVTSSQRRKLRGVSIYCHPWSQPATARK